MVVFMKHFESGLHQKHRTSHRVSCVQIIMLIYEKINPLIQEFDLTINIGYQYFSTTQKNL